MESYIRGVRTLHHYKRISSRDLGLNELRIYLPCVEARLRGNSKLTLGLTRSRSGAWIEVGRSSSPDMEPEGRKTAAGGRAGRIRAREAAADAEAGRAASAATRATAGEPRGDRGGGPGDGVRASGAPRGLGGPAAARGRRVHLAGCERLGRGGGRVRPDPDVSGGARGAVARVFARKSSANLDGEGIFIDSGS